MILVTLGTQDKSFKRLLDTVQKEIDRGNIKERVIVQAGYTKYISSDMEIFDLVSPQKLDELMMEARLIITHGGVGSILGALKYKKPVIAAARLSKYNEHTNDHQKQIVEEFEREGYLIALKDFNKLDKLLKKCENFIPKKYKSNNKEFVSLINDYIEEVGNTSWWNRYKKIIFIIMIFIILLLLILIGR